MRKLLKIHNIQYSVEGSDFLYFIDIFNKTMLIESICLL